MFKQQFISEVAFKYNIPILTLENIWTQILNKQPEQPEQSESDYIERKSETESETEFEFEDDTYSKCHSDCNSHRQIH